MNTSHIIESLNLTEGDSLTLEKAKDRMEFEMLPLILGACTCNEGSSYTYCGCNNGNETCSCNNKEITTCSSKDVA
jgi:hypothetical protein